QRTFTMRFYLRVDKFAQVGRLYGSAQLNRHGLHAVANAEYRNTEFKDNLRCAGRVGFDSGFGATGENDAVGVVVANFVFVHIPGADFREDADLAYTTGDELGVL